MTTSPSGPLDFAERLRRLQAVTDVALANLPLDDLDHADVLNPILREKGIKSMAGVPLIAHDDVFGVVHVGTLTPRLFRPADVELLEVVAQRAAVAIDRALAHEQVLRMMQVQRDFITL